MMTQCDEKEFESCCRHDFVVLEFNCAFALWMCEQNIIANTDYSADLFCMGWEI